MKCAHLRRALETLSRQAGYTPYSGAEQQLSGVVKEYPAAWLNTPKFRSIEGRLHGRVSYDVTMHLMHLAKRETNSETTARLDEMETQMVRIFSELSRYDHIVVIEGLEIKSSQLSLSNHGVISQTATAKVILTF